MSFRDRRQFLTQAGMAALVAALPRSTLVLQSAPASGGTVSGRILLGSLDISGTVGGIALG